MKTQLETESRAAAQVQRPSIVHFPTTLPLATQEKGVGAGEQHEGVDLDAVVNVNVNAIANVNATVNVNVELDEKDDDNIATAIGTADACVGSDISVNVNAGVDSAAS